MSPRRLQPHEDFMYAFRRVHFIGIGGVGMSGIAEVLHKLGYEVSGSDQSRSAVTAHLTSLGIRIAFGHEAANVTNADVVVASSAIAMDNVERVAARERRIPVVPRAEMLGELMRFRRGIAVAGTHGKTTTTSLIASVLGEAAYDPTFVIGGKLLAAGAHARLGEGEYLVAEADESDGSFLMLSPVLAIITNIDADHLENYGGDFTRVQKAFSDFLHRLPFYGLAVVCIDDPEVRKLVAQTSRNLLTYGFDEQADVRATSVRHQGAAMLFDLYLPDQEPLQAVRLNLPGRYNVLNALAAVACGWQLGVTPKTIIHALAGFQGVGRRFQQRGLLAHPRGQALLVDDYGHHPRELAAVFEAARAGWPERRLVVAFQPHRYTRTRDLMDDFSAVLSQVDVLLLTEVYAAGELPIAGADGRALARSVRSRGRVDPVLVPSAQELPEALANLLEDGDFLLMMGAGDIGAVINSVAQTGRVEEYKA